MKQKDPFKPVFEKKEVIKIMKRVADWQLANPSGTELWEWHYGPFYAGLISLYKKNLDSDLSTRGCP